MITELDKQRVMETREYEEEIRYIGIKHLMNSKSISELRYRLRVTLNIIEKLIDAEE